MKTAKKLLKESEDPSLALLSYCMTWCGLSPAELLQGRRLRSDVPQIEQNLVLDWPYVEKFQQQDKEFKLSRAAHRNCG